VLKYDHPKDVAITINFSSPNALDFNLVNNAFKKTPPAGGVLKRVLAPEAAK
jgi:hypothetical protein